MQGHRSWVRIRCIFVWKKITWLVWGFSGIKKLLLWPDCRTSRNPLDHRFMNYLVSSGNSFGWANTLIHCLEIPASLLVNQSIDLATRCLTLKYVPIFTLFFPCECSDFAKKTSWKILFADLLLEKNTVLHRKSTAHKISEQGWHWVTQMLMQLRGAHKSKISYNKVTYVRL
jgi:hypothetical protein